MDRIMLRVPEAAELLGISRAKCYQGVASGDIPSCLIAGVRRVPVEALKARVRGETGSEAA